MSESVAINLSEWVGQAREDPQLYLERQATEVVLNAIGMAPELESKIFLKGGMLMGALYQSPRQTGDLDFSTSLQPETGVDQVIGEALDKTLPRAAASLGYPDLVLRVQSVACEPRKNKFSQAKFPAVTIKIGYARRGTSQEKALAKRNAAKAVELDVTFNEPVSNFQILNLGLNGVSICAYALIELIAEKLRALLQQPIRNRYRRQDVYDIALLLRKIELSEEDVGQVFETFLAKCRARKIEPHPKSLSDPEVVLRAKAEWKTLSLEIGEVPPFEECFALVDAFYRNLPWGSRHAPHWTRCASLGTSAPAPAKKRGRRPAQ